MSCPGEDILTNLANKLVEKTIKEVRYFLYFEDHVQNFEIEHDILFAKRNKLQDDIEDAKRRNENKIEHDVQTWIERADNLIGGNTKIKQTWSYGRCAYWQYRQGKMLAKRTQTIRDHIQRYNFETVARPAELPGIKYHASREFIDFESRKSKLNELVNALEDGNHFMIGLRGMGGTGKTTLATQVGKQLEESKAFEKVIFVVVSKPPDVSNIRGNIARQLGLTLKEGEETEHSEQLWSRISNDNKNKLLIILDDMWEELDLREIGIPSGADHKHCYVLITTRDSKVCRAMKCQQIVRLDTLDDDDALKLFQFHARSSDDGSSGDDFEGLARALVKECGGLPIAIVALASTLRSWPIGEWNAALIALQNSQPLVDVDEELVEVYRCLSYSYDRLKTKNAQQLLLLSSLFPEDYEIPINLIIRFGIGLGFFGKVDKYWAARCKALGVKNELLASSLLLKVEKKECVKMHDLVREVAQQIAKEDIQVIMDSRTTLKQNKRFLFWSTDDFPDQFDSTKLEVLLLWISGNATLKDPNAFFVGMTELKILYLRGEYFRKVPPSSLLKSLLSLENVHTLILDGWELGDISMLKNLQNLVTLDLENCLILELPKDMEELKKLRLLGLRKCEIQKNNPFKVIERCSQLEELYFVENNDMEDWKPEDALEIEDGIAHDISLHQLQMYSIACSGFGLFNYSDNGLLTCFNSEHMNHLISEAMFKYFVGSAQVLELGDLGQTRWKNLVPDIISMDDGGKDNLMRLCLYAWADIECLIDTNKYHYLNKEVLSKLVELHMYGVNVKALYWGAMPSGFLRQLQILTLEKCMKLQNIFLDENLKLPHLKVLKLIDCPLFHTLIFQHVARSLVQLEELVVKDCKELKSLIACESLEEEMIVVDSDQKKYGLLFPELKAIHIQGCDKLEMVSSLLLAGDLPKLKDLSIYCCEELTYIFGEYRNVGPILQQESMLPSLIDVRLQGVPSFINVFQKCNRRAPQVSKEDSKEKYENSNSSAFSWALGCCFKASTNATLENRTISLESSTSSERIETFHTADCLMRQPLRLLNIRMMRLKRCSRLKSLFSVSIATTLIMLEELYISECGELKHIITNELEDDDHLNGTSIFPKLHSVEVSNCNKLEFIFPSTLCGTLPKLKSMDIEGANELKYIFGRYINLQALESLSLQWVSTISIVANTVEASKEIEEQMLNVTSEGAKEPEIQEIVNVETPLFQYALNQFHNLKKIKIILDNRLKTLLPISACRNLSQLSELYIGECEELVNVIEDDCNDLHHINYSSIFPKLESLTIYNCNKLEFIFPFSFYGTLQKLKSLNIWRAAELGYIFGKYDDGDYLSNENEREGLQIHLPALESLLFGEVPEMINNVRAEKYHLSFPSLQTIKLGHLQGLSFLDLMVYLQGIQLNARTPKDLMKMVKDVQRLTKLTIRDSNIEEVFNFKGMKIKGPAILSLKEMWLLNSNELRHIYKGPKYILSLPNLQTLCITTSKKLISIFSVSIVRSLPQLSYLRIVDCDELVDIIEESADDDLQELSFPELEEIYINRCKSLKYIFSISTYDMFPKLKVLEIEEASKLEQVFIHKQDDMKMPPIMEEVFPQLSKVKLRNLPTLITICEGIDFQAVNHFSVEACPNYQEMSQIQEGYENGDSENDTNVWLDDAEYNIENFNAEMSPIQEGYENGDSENDTSFWLDEVEEAIKRTIEEVAASMLSKEETTKEIEAEDPISALEKHALKGSAAKPQLTTTSPHSDTSLIVSQVKGSHSSSSTLITNQIIKDTMEQGLKGIYLEDEVMKVVGSTNSYSRKQSTGPINILSRKDSVLSAKERAKGMEEKDSVTDISPMATPFIRELNIKEVESNKPMEATLPQLISSPYNKPQIADAGSSPPKLGICEIFQLVELKHGETALLAQALERYPQLLLPREHRTPRITAWSYRVLVDILVMLATKTPYTITPSEKSALEANLSEAIVLGFDKEWVESVGAKVFGIDMSDVSAAKEEIQVMEMKIGEIDSHLKDLLEDRKELIENMSMFKDIVTAKDKPFGI